ncbi:MAG: HAD family phosphatase [Lentisphaerae bacterium]|nr:HAD family phosphatase [Lentisphaerota bacterium]MCP4100110.1 HAD family phosphatase [Lentisphaerota bacterium]
MNNKPDTIVFDFGGVLMDWNPRYLFQKLFDDENSMEFFLTEICSAGWNAKQDAGRSFAVATSELIEKHPDYAEMIEAYDYRWEETVSGAITPTVNILKKLHKNGYELYGLSNWSAEKFTVVRENYSFFGLFKDIILSGEEGIIKPEPEIYEILLKRIKKESSECLFIDDSKANVDAAEALGFHSIHFKDAEQLKTQLPDYGFCIK